MTREEEIKHAAQALVGGDTLTSPSLLIYFEIGAEWADDNPPQDVVNLNDVWHDASEEPQDKNKQILSYSEAFDYFFMDSPNYLIVTDGGQNKTWETVVLRYKMSKWAYIDELLPKGGEK